MDLHPIIQIFALDARARSFPPGLTLKYFTGKKEFFLVKLGSVNDLREIEFDIEVVVHMRFLVVWHAWSQELRACSSGSLVLFFSISPVNKFRI